MDNRRHLLTTNGLSIEAAERIFAATNDFVTLNRKNIKHDPILHGRTIINLFFENSTRTRVSFELAGKRLAADVITIQTENSSMGKGESLADMARTLNAMHADIITIRHPESGASELFARHVTCPVINAGDGTNEHPTQALLDAYTMRQALCLRDKSLSPASALNGKTIAICGDIRHSRVARSNIHLLKKFGANIRIIAPPSLLPSQPKSLGVDYGTSLIEGIQNADIIMMLRIQKERMANSFISSLADYSRNYCLTEAIISHAKKDVIVMHPGPMNRGIEIASCIADNPDYSVILNQVEHGVAIRQAVLTSLINKA